MYSAYVKPVISDKQKYCRISAQLTFYTDFTADLENVNKKGRQCRPSFFKSLNNNYSVILDTTPAPTVRPPSRIAKRKPSSIAIG